MHFLASNFHTIAHKEESDDPEIENKVSYCLLKKSQRQLSNESKRGSIERMGHDDGHRNRYTDKYMRVRDPKRPSTPPSMLKRKLILDQRENGILLFLILFRLQI
jgi:hypothetical protein